MKIVRLIGISKKGRERVKQHGDLWIVLEVRGDQMLVKSAKNFPNGDWRWIKSEGDDNFQVTV